MKIKQVYVAKLAGVERSTISKYASNYKVDHLPHTQKFKKYDVENTQDLIKKTSPFHKKKILKKVHTFYNFKGGTGKSTICQQVAMHVALMGFKVLCIDLDPQGHLSESLSDADFSNASTIYDILLNGDSFEGATYPVYKCLDLVPANLNLTRINTPLEQKVRREECLKREIDSIKDNYDFIFIDTNPSMSILNLNALVAADLINVICETQYKSVSGLNILREELMTFYEDMHLNLDYRVIANKYEAKLVSSQENLGVLRIEYKDNMIESIVRRSEDINLSSKNKEPVISFAGPKSTAVEDMVDLVHELLNISMEQPVATATAASNRGDKE